MSRAEAVGGLKVARKPRGWLCRVIIVRQQDRKHKDDLLQQMRNREAKGVTVTGGCMCVNGEKRRQ